MTVISKFSVDDAVRPVEIAERIWWVGHYLPGDSFQCHVYLIENGDQSVLIDPGSPLTIDYTLEKISQIIDFNDIKYFICQHQDPDITGAMPRLDKMITRPDAVLVTHWRAAALLKHYAMDLPFWRVEENDWQLDLGDRLLKFVFTPYAHFPGAFCTFDVKTGVLFSSDLFGGFTEGFSLIAEGESYLENLRPFHEHYMPSREILIHAMDALMVHPIELIAPQHGSIIPKHLINFLVDNLKTLDCGLYMLSNENSDIRRLSALNKILRDLTQTMIIYRDFRDIATAILEIARPMLPITELSFYSRTRDNEFLHLSPENRYLGTIKSPPEAIISYFDIPRPEWKIRMSKNYRIIDNNLILPLYAPEELTPQAIAVMSLNNILEDHSYVDAVINQLQTPLQVAVERETIYRSVELERQAFYERSIRDPLTGLYTRYFMKESVHRLFSVHDRDINASLGLAMIDIDHFKNINDTLGHGQGDKVLKKVADVIIDCTRGGDIPVRFGGEEFAVFLVSVSEKELDMLSERIRMAVEKIKFSEPGLNALTITVSIGTALRVQKEELDPFLERADMALYDAKRLGRNQVCRG